MYKEIQDIKYCSGTLYKIVPNTGCWTRGIMIFLDALKPTNKINIITFKLFKDENCLIMTYMISFL